MSDKILSRGAFERKMHEVYHNNRADAGSCYVDVHAHDSALRDRIEQQERKIKALRSVCTEARGWLGMEEHSLRDLLGDTNVAVMRDKIAAFDALDQPATPSEDDKPPFMDYSREDALLEAEERALAPSPETPKPPDWSVKWGDLDHRGEFDEVWIRNCFVHIERMDETAFWIGLDFGDDERIMLNTGVHRGTWYFNIDEDKIGDHVSHSIRRPRRASLKAAPMRNTSPETPKQTEEA